MINSYFGIILIMHFLENNYCQLKHYSFCNLTPSSHHYFQQVFISDSNKYYSYIETYGDISSVKHRILELNQEWRHGNIYKQNQKNLILGLINRLTSGGYDSYQSLQNILQNCGDWTDWGILLNVGMEATSILRNARARSPLRDKKIEGSSLYQYEISKKIIQIAIIS